jgi:hypothetical protein
VALLHRRLIPTLQRLPWLRTGALLSGLIVALASTIDLAATGAPRLSVDLLGLVLGAIVVVAVQDAPPEPIESSPPPQLSQAVRRTILGSIVLGLGVLAGASAVTQLLQDTEAWQAALPWWLASLCLALMAAPVFDAHAGRPFRLGPHHGACLALLAPLAVTLLALALRLFRLDSLPPGVFVDDVRVALDAIQIVEGVPLSPFGTGWYEIPLGYAYVQAAAIAVLGPTNLALKLPPVIGGTLAVLGTYFLGRLLFGARVGFAAAVLLAVAFWPLSMSRWAFYTLIPPAVHVWSVYFLVRGFRDGRALDFALGGLILGAGMYSYLSIRLVVVALVGYIVYRSLCRDGFFARYRWQLALFGLLWALTFAPLAVTYARDPFTFLNRSQEIGIQRDIEKTGGSLLPLLENVRRYALMFNVEGDHNARHHLPGTPQLDPLMGALFVLAVVRGLVQWRDHRQALLLIWIPTILLGGVLSNLAESPNALRTHGVMPAVALLCGETLVRLAERLGVPLGRLLAAIPHAQISTPALLLGAGLLASGWMNVRWYFLDYASDARLAAAFLGQDMTLAREVARAPDPEAYYLASRFYLSSVVRYFTAAPLLRAGESTRTPRFQLFQSVDDLPVRASGNTDAVLVLDPDWPSAGYVVRQVYPNAFIETVLDDVGNPLYLRAIVPSQDILEARGLTASARWDDGRREESRVPDPANGMSGDQGSVEWSGSLYIPRSGLHIVTAVDGSVVLVNGSLADRPVYLSKGLHTLSAVQTGERSRSGLHLVRSESDDEDALAVPPEHLYPRQIRLEHGLTGTYRVGASWDAQPLTQRTDPVIFLQWEEREPVEGPFTVVWEGEIEAGTTGEHLFIVEADDGARLWLDGEVVGEGMVPGRANVVEARRTLNAGRHPIRLEYFQQGGGKAIRLRWAPPGSPRAPVPAEVLWPSAP